MTKLRSTLLLFCALISLSTIAIAQNSDTSSKHPLQIVEENKVFTAVDVTPEPQGGMQAFYQLLSKNIRYPSADKIYNIQGRVIIQFIVERDGSLNDLRIVRSPSTTLSDETIRVLKLSPKWSPGMQNKVPVRVQYTIPVNYSLGGGDDQAFAELIGFLNNSANYPDAIKNNHDAGLVVMTINVVKNHIADVHVDKGATEELNKALTNLVTSYRNEVKTRNAAYSLIFKLGYDTIDTSTLNGYAKPDQVIGIVEIKLAKK